MRAIEHRQAQKISCLEEIAFIQGWIDRVELEKAAQLLGKSSFGGYLRQVLEEYT